LADGVYSASLDISLNYDVASRQRETRGWVGKRNEEVTTGIKGRGDGERGREKEENEWFHTSRTKVTPLSLSAVASSCFVSEYQSIF